MAVPASFDESNGMLDCAPGDEDIVTPLSIWRGEATNSNGNTLTTVISCWKLTAEELEEVNRTGRIWLGVMGSTMSPAWISGLKPFGDEIT